MRFVQLCHVQSGLEKHPEEIEEVSLNRDVQGGQKKKKKKTITILIKNYKK